MYDEEVIMLQNKGSHTSICSNCYFDTNCINVHENEEKYFCDQHYTASYRPNDQTAMHSDIIKHKEYTGLCETCAYSDRCVFKNVVGSVWWCEEYSEIK